MVSGAENPPKSTALADKAIDKRFSTLPSWTPRDGRNVHYEEWEKALKLVSNHLETTDIVEKGMTTLSEFKKNMKSIIPMDDMDAKYNELIEDERARSTTLAHLVLGSLSWKSSHPDADEDEAKALTFFKGSKGDARGLILHARSYADCSSAAEQTKLHLQLKHLQDVKDTPNLVGSIVLLKKHLNEMRRVWLLTKPNSLSDTSDLYDRIKLSLPVTPGSSPVALTRAKLVDWIVQDSKLLDDVDACFRSLVSYAAEQGLPNLGTQQAVFNIASIASSGVSQDGGTPASDSEAYWAEKIWKTALQMFLAKMLCLPFSTNGKEVDQRTTSSSRSMTANAAIRILAHLMYVGESITASAGTALPGNRVPSLTSPNSAEARKRMSTFTVDILLRTQHLRHSRV